MISKSLLVVLLAVSVSYTFSQQSDCDSAHAYDCPVSGDIKLVADCLQCDDYAFADETHKMCVKRNLFSSDDHYHYLAQDIGGTFVWMITAGVASACGVGGGGIFMPLGILLLGFAAKSASGLSQASIFGASPSRPAAGTGTDYTQVVVSDDEPAAASLNDQDQEVAPVKVALTAEEIEQQVSFLELDARQFPPEKMAALVVLLIVMILLTFMKGGKGVDSLVGVTCTDTAYPVLVALQFVWLFGFATYYGFVTVGAREERERVQYPFYEKDVAWTQEKAKTYAAMSFAAGIIAGLIGVGGGMVLGPLMLQMGIDSRVSSAVTASMIVLTSSSVAIMYVISGFIPVEYFIYFFSVCFVGAYIGKSKIDAYVKKTGMASLLVGILASIISFAVVGCLYTIFSRLHERNWCLDGFKKLCG
eukprot:GSChrysophyteH1.ASY1.ANO1.2584.1 assembled CDS